MVNGKTYLPFEQLNVYQLSLDLINNIYMLTTTWPKNEYYCLTDQLRRASTSIALTIAEGSSRTKKDFRHYLDISRGSCYECIAILTIAKHRHFITEEQYSKFYEKSTSLIRMLNALKKSLLKP